MLHLTWIFWGTLIAWGTQPSLEARLEQLEKRVKKLEDSSAGAPLGQASTAPTPLPNRFACQVRLNGRLIETRGPTLAEARRLFQKECLIVHSQNELACSQMTCSERQEP